MTDEGPRTLEFNCRFGDPEAQVLLPLLETDPYIVMKSCCRGLLSDADVSYETDRCAATVVCAAKGYPGKYDKGYVISGLEDVASGCDDCYVYHAGAKVDEAGRTVTNGGRVLSVTGTGPTIKKSIDAAYRGARMISFGDPEFASAQGRPTEKQENFLHMRSDIGRRAMTAKLRVGVMGSTRGTSLLPIIDAISSGELGGAEIVAIVSDREKAGILEKGRSLGPAVTCVAVSAKGKTRSEFDAECSAVLEDCGVELVVLIGYMRILSPEFCRHWEGRCLNVHPSLLPRHGGLMDLKVHASVLASGDAETGCTVHLVTEEVDGGGIVLQMKCQVCRGDTPETLKGKVQKLEGVSYVRAIRKFAERGDKVTYKDAGVDIVAGSDLVDMIKPACKSTARPGCDTDLGGFGSLFDLSAAGYAGDDVVIVGATDGVGTKLAVAKGAGSHGRVGIDLVAMCVNDLIVTGAEPLFFLDYYATGKLDVEEAADVVRGIADGCRQANCGLVGGETAEMPSMYAKGDYDLGGFAVGAVRKPDVLPRNVGLGDVLVGLPSSGIHSNGFSLVRKLLQKEGLSYADRAPWEEGGMTVGESLLTPTQIYVKSVMPLLRRGLLNGSAHITGGGLLENLNRSLGSDVDASVDFHPPLPKVFQWMMKSSGLDDDGMLRTFNCGVGFVLIVKADKVYECMDLLKEGGTEGFVMGKIVQGTGNVQANFTLTG